MHTLFAWVVGGGQIGAESGRSSRCKQQGGGCVVLCRSVSVQLYGRILDLLAAVHTYSTVVPVLQPYCTDLHAGRWVGGPACIIIRLYV